MLKFFASHIGLDYDYEIGLRDSVWRHRVHASSLIIIVRLQRGGGVARRTGQSNHPRSQTVVLSALSSAASWQYTTGEKAAARMGLRLSGNRHSQESLGFTQRRIVVLRCGRGDSLRSRRERATALCRSHGGHYMHGGGWSVHRFTSFSSKEMDNFEPNCSLHRQQVNQSKSSINGILVLVLRFIRAGSSLRPVKRPEGIERRSPMFVYGRPRLFSLCTSSVWPSFRWASRH